jgi:hypothetical protein
MVISVFVGFAVRRKNTSGRSSGNILYSVIAKTTTTTTVATNTSVNNLDSKIGGSMRFCTFFSPCDMVIVEKMTVVVQAKITYF